MGLLWYGKQQLQSPYTIRAEWRIYADDDNSGLFIGFPDPGDDPWKPVAEGYEIQIDPTDGDPTRRTGSVYSFQAANAASLALALKPHGEWNVMEVQVDGQLIVIRLNGVEINRYTSPHPERDPSAGFFGIQNDGTGADVSYRSVQVKGGGLEAEPTPTPTRDAHRDGDRDGDGHGDRHRYGDRDRDRRAAGHARARSRSRARPRRRPRRSSPPTSSRPRA